MNNKLASAIRHQLTIAKLAAVVTGIGGLATAQAQQAPLPVPCGAGACGAPRVSYGSADYATNATVATVTQHTDRAILNWQSFNIAAGNTVNFVQPSSSAAALNRIFQNDPSRILGSLNANGHVYLINQNGIVFGNGAQVNTGALVASALNISDDIFTNIGLTGAISPVNGGRAAFEGTPGSTAAITVEQGATLTSGERVFLIAPKVENRGTISTPDGQTILAASHDRVYVASDRQLRGLLVEVDTGGSAANFGDILTERGNTTLVGLAVNQSGRIGATTSVNVNGSIRLVAQDRAQVENTGRLSATRGGELSLGAGSVTAVLPELDSTDTAVDGQEQSRSAIALMGRTVELQGDAQVRAPGGTVDVWAANNPYLQTTDRTNTIHLAAGSVIDVSGDDSAVIAMERNQGSLRLFGNELADAPAQRNGPLARAEVTVDLRVGTPLTDITRLREGVERGVGERLSAGGQVSLSAGAGDVVINPGAQIDFSGGQVRYLDGYLNTSLLVTAEGRIVNIANADPNVLYAGIVGRVPATSNRWGATPELQSASLAQFQPGYVEGRDAGSLTIDGGRVALNGELRGAAMRGDLQRNPATPISNSLNRNYTEVPLSGLLFVGGSDALRFTNARQVQAFDFGTALPDAFSTLLSTQLLRDAGIGRLVAGARSNLVLGEDVRLHLSPGGTVSLQARDISIAGNIEIAAGRFNAFAPSSDVQLGHIEVASTANIDLRGNWVNDLALVNNNAPGTDALFTHGGSASFASEGDLILVHGSVIDVSAGAQLRSNGSLRYGRAGSIALSSKIPSSNVITELDLSGTLRGFGFSQGGSLRISAASFLIGDTVVNGANTPGEIALSPEFFRTGGFASYALNADRGSIVVEDNTQLLLSPLSFQLLGAYQTRATGSDLRGFTHNTVLPELLRGTSSFAATVSRTANVSDAQANVRVGQDARIQTEAGGSIALESDSDLFLNGSLIAHGGQVALTLKATSVSANERGYRASQAIHLDSRADIDVSGIAQVETNDLGYRSGRVLDGGAISMQADRGYIIANPGSRLDVSGTQAVLDFPGVWSVPTATNIASDGGTIRVAASEGIVFSSALHGMPGGQHAEGGTFAVTIDATRRDPPFLVENSSNPQFPNLQREVVVGESFNIAVGPGVNVPLALNGKAFVSTTSLVSGGFDNIELAALPLTTAANNGLSSYSPGAIRFDGDVSLIAGRRIALNAQVIASSGGDAFLSAPLLTIGPTATGLRAPATPIAGIGNLSVVADHIDFVGHTVFSGFDIDASQPALHFASSGDIRFNGVRFSDTQAGNLPGSIRSLASIEFLADQLYPSTLTDFSIAVIGANGRIAIDRNDGAITVPLSAAGALRLSAADIVQAGVIRAPFGTLELDASHSLTLAAGSVTSTSGAGARIPFGLLELGSDWVYPLVGRQLVLSDAPEQNVLLRSPSVTLAEGSQVDIRGGGDLLSYEFIKGPGGSRDILLANNLEGAFAIVPGANVFGVIDPNESLAAGIDVGSTITLAGGNGLPTGEFARLPARYALLPGAYLVVPVTNAPNIQPGTTQVMADGATTVVAGRTGFAGTDVHAAQWSGYAVLNGDQVRDRAQYNTQLASTYFQDGAGNPRDAGRLTIDATQAVRLDGQLSAAAANGRAAQVDIVANSLAVVNARTSSTQRVELVASELQEFGAASLLLGGSRRETGSTTDLTVRAQAVVVEGGATLNAEEIILAAQDTITVAGNASLLATTQPTTIDTSEGADPQFRVTGDGAFVRVAATEQVTLDRTQSAGQRGRVNIQQGAVLAGDAINLEASRDVLSQGELRTDGSLSLTTAQISLGTAPLNTPGLVLTNEDLARLQADELLLNSRSTIDLYGAVTAHAENVRLDAAGLRGFGTSGTLAEIGGTTLTVGNSRNASVTAQGTGSGSVSLSADTLRIESGAFDIGGFTDARLLATREVVADGQATMRVRGDLGVTAPRITATAGADLALTADRALTTTALAAPSDLGPTELGARIELSAQSIQHGSRIELPSGVVNMTATGAEGVTLAAQSVIDVSGRDIDFREVIVGSPGGVVTLTATQGNVTVANQATIDVSGAAAGGDAGRIALRANTGSVQVGDAATLRGSASVSAKQGAFEVEARSLAASFSALNTQLNAGGFAERRAIAVQTGDINIAASDVVNARNVTFTTDAGNLSVAGRVNAAASEGGRVRLSAGNNVTVQQSGVIDAHATAAGEEGGFVELATRSGMVAMQGTVNVSGRDAAGNSVDAGHVNLRAPRIGNNSVAVSPITGSVTGAERIDIEAFRVYNATRINSTLIGEIASDTATYMANAAAIETSLGVASDERFHLLPGVEVASAGDLTLATPWDLLGQRAGGEAGVLTLRAAGNLNIDQDLSDGVANVAAVDLLPVRDVVQTGPSWSYRLVAGANGADPLKTTRGAGTTTVADNTFVRTGTGSIDIAAGDDVVLATRTSAIYTTGENRGVGALDPADAEIILRGDFVHNGGDIRIAAGGNVQGVVDRALPDWMPRVALEYQFYRPGVQFPGGWAIDVSKFYQGFGALGGGDVDVVAGGNMESVLLALPTNGQPNAMDGTDTRIAGGGDLSVDVTGDILGGVYVVGRGRADVRSSGAITQPTAGMFPILQVGDAQISLQGRTGVTIETVFNPTMAEADPNQGLLDYIGFPDPQYFFTYTDRSSVALTAISGDTTLSANSSGIAGMYDDGRVADNGYLGIYAPSLLARSLQGDVRINGAIELFPSAAGTVELLAGRDVTSQTASATINLSDGDLSLFPTAARPVRGFAPQLLIGHAPTPVHALDDVPALIVARDGSITPAVGGTLRFDIGKQARFFASTDISNIALNVQHARLGDITTLTAGRDIVNSTNRRPDGLLDSNSNVIRVSGPGRVDLVAGRNVDFGSAAGIETIGNTGNPALADQGADINIWTGQSTRPDYARFINRYLAQGDAYSEQLHAYLARFPVNAALSDVDNFRALPELHQREFIAQVFFAEIKAGGLSDFTAGFDAIATLFPNTDVSAYAGDLTSFLSYIRTVDGGDINMIVPNGIVNAGVASSGGIQKSPSDLGVVVQRAGNINAVTRSDFLVNASRVFSLDGGDIMIWSSAGNIDAGRGSKAALSIPPPIVTVDPLSGVVTTELSAAISGSGIRTAVSTPGRDPGDVFLFAPQGVVDAGDAGIDSAGNITIAATRVIGADNIQVGGTSVGVPVNSGGLGASLAGVSSTANSATNSATMADTGAAQASEQQASLADTALSWLEVFVVGLGEEGCKQDDIECLKRQK